ncbi:hypothetical protein [Alicyclobacillus fodiniaquatilis]|uniref:Uncharacterized protein n=1 Tax=Alicyclobacillus fodiniaquatilis TaxID=1661150 RepID=A0ABW4JIT3_9BACL
MGIVYEKNVQCQFLLETIVEMSRHIQLLQERYILPQDISSTELTAFISMCATEFNDKLGEQFRNSPNKYSDGYYYAVDQFLMKCLEVQYTEELEEARMAAPIVVIKWHRADIQDALEDKGIEATSANVDRYVQSEAIRLFQQRCVSYGANAIHDSLDEVFEI